MKILPVIVVEPGKNPSMVFYVALRQYPGGKARRSAASAGQYYRKRLSVVQFASEPEQSALASPEQVNERLR